MPRAPHFSASGQPVDSEPEMRLLTIHELKGEGEGEGESESEDDKAAIERMPVYAPTTHKMPRTSHFSASNLPEYEWLPIDSEQEIRLLTIHDLRGGSESEEDKAPMERMPVCTLTTHNRHDASRYEALSYTWGSTVRDQDIVCDCRRLRVTGNCMAAVLALGTMPSTFGTRPRKVWIDAVCINQDDLLERNVQVARMGDVFRKAQNTVIYLGQTDPSINLTERLLTQYRLTSEALSGEKGLQLRRQFESDLRTSRQVTEALREVSKTLFSDYSDSLGSGRYVFKGRMAVESDERIGIDQAIVQ